MSLLAVDLNKFHVREQKGRQLAAVHRPGVYADFVAFHQGFGKNGMPENYWFTEIKRRTDKTIPNPEAPVRTLSAYVYPGLQPGVDINTVSVFMGKGKGLKKSSVGGGQKLEEVAVLIRGNRITA